MIEALLLVGILSGMVLLLFNIRRASKPDAPQTLGILAYVSVKPEAGSKNKKKVKPRA